MRKLNIPVVNIRLVQDMYKGATTCEKSKRGTGEHFEVGIAIHHGSALSPFLIIMLVDTMSQDARSELPWELPCDDDLAIIDITCTDTQNRLASWQWSEEQCGKNRISVNKGNYVRMKLNGEELKNVDHFKYST